MLVSGVFVSLLGGGGLREACTAFACRVPQSGERISGFLLFGNGLVLGPNGG